MLSRMCQVMHVLTKRMGALTYDMNCSVVYSILSHTVVRGLHACDWWCHLDEMPINGQLLTSGILPASDIARMSELHESYGFQCSNNQEPSGLKLPRDVDCG